MQKSSSARSRDCITRTSFREPESAWRSSNGSFGDMPEPFGPKPSRATARPFLSPSENLKMTTADKIILLVEDNPDDAKLTLRAFKQSNIANPVVVARDGIEALDFLFARGAHSERAGKPQPTLIVLDLKLPRLDGL